jgi:hypothetical protein
VTKETITRWNKAGKINPVKVGNKNMYLKKDIEFIFNMKINEVEKIEDVKVSYKALEKLIRVNFPDIFKMFKSLAIEKIAGVEKYYEVIE